jgi:hypothetical protein
MFAGEKQVNHIRKEYMNSAATAYNNGLQFVRIMNRALVIKSKWRAGVL